MRVGKMGWRVLGAMDDTEGLDRIQIAQLAGLTPDQVSGTLQRLKRMLLVECRQGYMGYSWFTRPAVVCDYARDEGRP